MKKRLLHGFGAALLFASPIWLTISEPPSYSTFAISLVLGLLLIIVAREIA